MLRMRRIRKNTFIRWKNGSRVAARLSTCILRTTEAAFPIPAVVITLRERWVLAFFKLTELFWQPGRVRTAAAAPAIRPFTPRARILQIPANGPLDRISRTMTTRAIRLLLYCQTVGHWCWVIPERFMSLMEKLLLRDLLRGLAAV